MFAKPKCDNVQIVMVFTLFSHVVTALLPCDRILTQCDKLEMEQYTQKCTESGVYYNTVVFYSKDLLGI